MIPCGGVPAWRADPVPRSSPRIPAAVSAMVGTSGSMSNRPVPATASARSAARADVRQRRRHHVEGQPAPARRPDRAIMGAPPRYGTCRQSALKATKAYPEVRRPFVSTRRPTMTHKHPGTRWNPSRTIRRTTMVRAMHMSCAPSRVSFVAVDALAPLIYAFDTASIAD